MVLALVLSLLPGPLATIASPAPKDLSLPTLTRIEQIRHLTPEEAERHYPVHIQAVTTFFTARVYQGPIQGRVLPPVPDLFVQDSTAGIWVDVKGLPLQKPPLIGQLLDIEGVTADPDFAPQIEKVRWKVIGRAPLPMPHFVSYQRMASTAEDSEWVAFRGIVRSALNAQGYLIMDVAVDDGRLTALIPALQGARPGQLVDSQVEIQGVCAAYFNQKMEFTGVLVYVPSPRQLRVIERGSPDPFAAPSRSLGDFRRFAPAGKPWHRVRIQGIVTMQLRGQFLFIRDPNDETQVFEVETDQNTSVQPGDFVDVSGFFVPGGFAPILEDAVFRRLQTGLPATSARVTAASALQGDAERELVQLDGLLVARIRRAGLQTLSVQAGNLIINADLEGPGTENALPGLRDGSQVRLTGICMVQVNQRKHPRRIRLLLRSPADVVVLRNPSWWTPNHASLVLGFLGIAILTALAWVVLLRRRVRQQTEVILERYEREQALEERYRDLFENANDVIFTADLEGRLTSVNKAVERITGYTREEILHKPIDWAVAPEHVERVRQILAQEIRDGGTTTYELEVCAKDGRRVALEISSRIVYENGRPAGIHGTARDVTERKRAEAENRRLATAIEQAAEGILVTDVEGRIEYVNPSFTTMTGYSRDEVLGQNPRVLKSGRQDVKFYQEMWTAILSGKVWHGELVNRRKDGSLYTEGVTIAPVRDSRGLTTHFIATKQDVTERKRAELELHRAKEAAEAANEAKGQFLANMSHEIRTPMNGIMGMTHLALETELTREQREYLEMVKSSADSLLTIINDILDFSKIEAGKMALDQVEFDLSASLEQTLRPLALRARQSGLDLNYHVTPGVPRMLVGDPGRLRQIIVNLIGNGLKFTERGEVTLGVEAWPAPDGTAQLHFSIRDSGVGIPLERQAAIFEAFTQADGSPSRRYGGTGLGLTISKGLVEMMGGRIWVESVVGQGSTFHFTVSLGVGGSQAAPLTGEAVTRSPAPPPGSAETAAPVTNHLREKKGKLRVLLAEDNLVNQRLAARLMEKQGHHVTVVGNGRASLEALDREEFHVVLMDVQMPEMDGFEATAAIRARERRMGGHLPIIAMTAHAMKGDRERCLAAGMDGYVSKPIRPQDLDQVLNDLVECVT